MTLNNKDQFLSLDFGLKEFGLLDEKERFGRYRRFVYETGDVDLRQRGTYRYQNSYLLGVVGGYNHLSLPVALADHLKVHVRTGFIDGRIAQLADDG